MVRPRLPLWQLLAAAGRSLRPRAALSAPAALGLLIAGVLQGLADFRPGGSVGLHALDQRFDFLALGLTGSAPGFARGGAVCKALG